MPSNDFPNAVRALAQSAEFSSFLGRHFPDEDALLFFLCQMLIPVARHGFLNSERKEKLFELAQGIGVHILTTHFYSPVPNTSELPDSVWGTPFPLQLDDAAMAVLIEQASFYGHELDQVPDEAPAGTLHWKNPALYIGDALLYYCLLRHFRPARVIEVGGGYSTLVSRIASRRSPFRLECVEPFPYPWLRDVPDELLECPVQNVPLERFSSLQAGDILFIDSTHVVKTGSDVVHLFLRVLPVLQPGVIVHVHDIFLPFEYDQKWVKERHIFWNEQYFLLAFLAGNESWEVLEAHWYAGQKLSGTLLKAFPKVNPPGGGSFWMRKKR